MKLHKERHKEFDQGGFFRYCNPKRKIISQEFGNGQAKQRWLRAELCSLKIHVLKP